MTRCVELRFTNGIYSLECIDVNSRRSLGFADIVIRNDEDYDEIKIDLDHKPLDNPEFKKRIENAIRNENKKYGEVIAKIPIKFSIEWNDKSIVFELQEIGYGAKIGDLVIAETRGMFSNKWGWSLNQYE